MPQRLSTLVVERIADFGSIGTTMHYGPHNVPLGYTRYKAHPLRIILDGRDVGIFSSPGTPERPQRRKFDIEAGHHTLTIDIKRVGGIRGLLITFFVVNVKPSTESFDIAPNETVTFICMFKHPFGEGIAGYSPEGIMLMKK